MALSALYARPEKAIIVVSHSGFLRQGVTGSWFVNADYRVFDFEPREDENQPYRLRQWEETEARGGGMGNSWTHRVEIGADLPDEELWPEREGRV